MLDLISFQAITTGIENLHFPSKILHLIKVLSVAMAKTLPKGATCRTPQEGGIFQFLSHTHMYRHFNLIIFSLHPSESLLYSWISCMSTSAVWKDLFLSSSPL